MAEILLEVVVKRQFVSLLFFVTPSTISTMISFLTLLGIVLMGGLRRSLYFLKSKISVGVVLWCNISYEATLLSKSYIPSTLNIDLILCHTKLIVCAENVKSWFKSWVFPFTFQAYILPHTLNCMCVSLFKFHIWILEQF